MKTKKMLICAGIILTICFSFSLASGQGMSSEKRTVLLPQGVDVKAVMEVGVNEGKKMKYDLKLEGDRSILHKAYRPNVAMAHQDHIYQISLTITAGEDGRKVLMMETEHLGDSSNPGWYGPNLHDDVSKIEKAVKSYLAAK